MAKSTQQQLRDLLGQVERLQPDDDNRLACQAQLAAAITQARSHPAPLGDPGHIESVCSRYRDAASRVDGVSGKVRAIATEGLPGSWTGHAGEKAGEAIHAAAHSTGRMAQKFQEAGPVLLALADGIREAQDSHAQGLSALQAAGSVVDLSPLLLHADDLKRVRAAVSHGIGLLIKAASRAEESGRQAEKALHKLASEARAGRLGTNGLTDTDRLVLADAAGPEGPSDLNEILTANELSRSSQFRDRLGETDRGEFDRLLGQAKSPQERAYLMKALAAGYDMNALRPYAEQIHGREPMWLARHLAPFHTESTNSTTPAEFSPGAPWAQAPNEGTCVASSTVTARAMADPLYALRLTTGGRPGDPKEDNPERFQQRLLDEQHRVNEEGHGGPLPEAGMGLEGKTTVLGDELTPHTGGRYELRNTPSAQARHDALPEIEQAVDDGKPVPIGVQGFDAQGRRSGHAMLIVGHEGDRLQIYNPWGHTTWVTEDDFINNHMDKASDSRLPESYAYHLPK